MSVLGAENQLEASRRAIDESRDPLEGVRGCALTPDGEGRHSRSSWVLSDERLGEVRDGLSYEFLGGVTELRIVVSVVVAARTRGRRVDLRIDRPGRADRQDLLERPRVISALSPRVTA